MTWHEYRTLSFSDLVREEILTLYNEASLSIEYVRSLDYFENQIMFGKITRNYVWCLCVDVLKLLKMSLWRSLDAPFRELSMSWFCSVDRWSQLAHSDFFCVFFLSEGRSWTVTLNSCPCPPSEHMILLWLEHWSLRQITVQRLFSFHPLLPGIRCSHMNIRGSSLPLTVCRIRWKLSLL